jgi:hypothetical protein
VKDLLALVERLLLHQETIHLPCCYLPKQQ